MAKSDDFKSIEYQLAAHLRDSSQPIDDSLDPQRLALYRELTRNNLFGFINNTFPLSQQILADIWPQLLEEFVKLHRCDSPIFLEIPTEFLAFMQQHYPNGIDGKKFINELLHYEWVELDVASKQAQPLQPWQGGMATRLYCHQAAVALSYHYAVHKISPEQQPQQMPHQLTHLLVYRDPQDEVTFMELSAPLVIALQLLEDSNGLTAEQWIKQLIAQCPQFPKDVLTNGLISILPELSQRGIIGELAAD